MDLSKIGIAVGGGFVQSSSKREPTPFIKKLVDVTQTIARTDVKDRKDVAFMFVGLEGVDHKTGQAVAAAVGTPEMLEELATSLINHPDIGPLIMLVATNKIINERYPDEEGE